MRRRQFARWVGAAAGGGLVGLSGCAEKTEEGSISRAQTGTVTPTESMMSRRVDPEAPPVPDIDPNQAGGELFSSVVPVEKAVYQKTNQFRNKKSLRPLMLDRFLSDIARAYSCSMLDNEFRGHIDQQGRSASDRVDKYGFPYDRVGENLVYLPEKWIAGEYGKVTANNAADATIQMWADGEHRKNLVNDSLKSSGVGACVGEYGQGTWIYITAMYSGRPPVVTDTNTEKK